MGGFECSTQITLAGRRLDMIAANQHDIRAEQDYALLQSVGIATARDGLRWHLIDRGGHYNFESFLPMLQAAVRQGVQVIWDLMHYGYPDDLDLFSPAFVDRFARFSRCIAALVADHTGEIPFYSPVNEISFYAWAAGRRYMYPYADGRGNDIKRQLVRASIAAMDTIRSVDPRARFVFPDPILHAFAPDDRPDLQAKAQAEIDSQYEAWDMLAAEGYLDIVGCNFYYRNQWELESQRVFLEWSQRAGRDPRWVPLRELLRRVHARYQRPMILAETGHIGSGRAEWLHDATIEVLEALRAGIPIEGVCLYPIIDRYDWDNPDHWHNSGLWDLDPQLNRVINEEYAAELRRSQELISSYQACSASAATPPD